MINVTESGRVPYSVLAENGRNAARQYLKQFGDTGFRLVGHSTFGKQFNVTMDKDYGGRVSNIYGT